MSALRHPKARAALKEYFPAITAGVKALGEVAKFELGGRAADALPTSIADNYAKRQVNQAVDDFVEDILKVLRDQQ